MIGMYARMVVPMLLVLLPAQLQHSNAVDARAIDLIILEHYHPDAEYVRISVVDGDTVRLLDRGESVRLVGYNAYELREPLGKDAKAYLQGLCSDGHAYMLVDRLEPRDRYGRLLGYLWCSVRVDGYTAWISVQRAFLTSNLIKDELYIRPDLYPYWVWREKMEMVFDGAEGRIGRVTVVDADGVRTHNATSVTLPVGVYRVCLASGDPCMLVNTLDRYDDNDDGNGGDGVYRVDVDELIHTKETIHVSSVEGRRMAFIHIDVPSLYIGSVRIVADGGFMARVKVVTDDGRVMASVVRDGSDEVQIDSRVILVKVYMVKKDSREVCIDGLGGSVMLNGTGVDRPCVRFGR
ncbi:MAG: thermonuclease family protein [Candidatus Nitrosocaldus sp.]|nr:thermonuclease family protein [Candidatus Nitrosocaldus sp.]MCS7141653.1 thermonuclease family protein [Candidatus Nitrosocaldus sp.]MDW8000619.1 thermonuclease family protein [Candidatus Nitrosocaldus sp.]MDW8274961.1 thermonuclease family protein [Candidatus Nitrosocaldus sp.]